MFMRKIVAGSSALLMAAVPATVASSDPEPPCPPSEEGRLICRASELPIYPTHDQRMVTKVEIEEPSSLQKALLEPVSFMRVGVMSVLQHARDASTQFKDTIHDSTERFSFIVTYLREEDNEAQRIGAMAMGTLTGFIFGLRGGIIRRLTYSLLATAGMGSICYPEQARTYSNTATNEGKMLFNVAYNFVYGIKPGDPKPEITFPDLTVPTNFNELVDLASNISKTAKDVLTPPNKERAEEPTEPKETKEE